MRLKYEHYSYDFSAHIVDIQVTTVGADAFSEVRHGILRLKCGPMLRRTIESLKSHIEFM
jgi:hypothetical protein